MKAKVIKDGRIIEVEKAPIGYVECSVANIDGFPMQNFYSKKELEFLPDTEEVTIEGWVARDKGGGIYLHFGEPVRGTYEWYSVMCPPRQLPKESFPEVTWDSEPLKVKITITPME